MSWAPLSLRTGFEKSLGTAEHDGSTERAMSMVARQRIFALVVVGSAGCQADKVLAADPSLQSCHATPKPNGMGVDYACGEIIAEFSDWSDAQWPGMTVDNLIETNLAGMEKALKRSRLNSTRGTRIVAGESLPAAEFHVTPVSDPGQLLLAGTVIGKRLPDATRVASCGVRRRTTELTARCDTLLQLLITGRSIDEAAPKRGAQSGRR